jgi:rod shape-determining protein MreD
VGRNGVCVVAASFLVAIMLTSVPLPDWAAIWRPAWVALVLSYWCFALPNRIGVGVGFACGLVLDVLTGALLGQHALGLSVVAFVAHQSHLRIRVLPPWQQALSLFPIVAAYQMLVLWTSGIRGLPVDGWAYLTAPLTSMLLWPWVFIVLRDLRRKFSVA